MSKTSHARHFSKRQSTGCTNGGFWKSPKSGDNIDTSQQIDIQWDTSLDCFSSQGIDVYLYAPYAAKSVIHAWGGLSYSSGSFQTTLSGSWWNSTSTPIQLQLAVVESGTPAFLATVPPGPIFTSTFNATDFGLKNPTGGSSSTPATSSATEGGGIFQTIGNAYKNSGLPKGSIAAAVIVPLIAVAIGIAVYVKFQRAKEAEKRKRWSAAVDKRMSTISTEWKGLPPNAQSEAIRQSIAIMRDSRASTARMSQLYGPDGRPSSVFDGGKAGVGISAVGIGARKGTGVGLRNPALGPAQMEGRKSTVSFAPTTRFSRANPSDVSLPLPSTDKSRPSTDTQRGRASRAFHTAIGANDDGGANVDVDGLMSPSQVGGPAMLTDEGLMPALHMMHHQDSHNQDDSDFLVLSHTPTDASHSPITPPSAAQLTPTSATPFKASTPYSPSYGNSTAYGTTINTNPFEGFTNGPSNMMSPDAMLRAYASRSPTSPGAANNVPAGVPIFVAPASPPPSATNPYAPYGSMYPALDAPAQPDLLPGPPPPQAARTLYAPGQDRNTVHSEGSRYSVAEADETDEDAYGGLGHAA